MGNAVDAEELSKGLAAAAAGECSRKFNTMEPGQEPDEEMDEANMTPEQIGEPLPCKPMQFHTFNL